MKPKISLSITDLPITVSIKELFAFAKKIRVDGVEVVLGYKTYFAFDHLKKLSNQFNIPILSIHQPIGFILRKKYDEHGFEIVKYFNAKYVAHPLHNLSLSDKKSHQFFAWLSQMARKYKIIILIENLPKKCTPPLNLFIKHHRSLSNLIDLQKICLKYRFGLTLDITHLKKDVPQEVPGFNLIQPIMENIHLSDFNNKHDHLPLGEGNLDLKAFFKCLRSISYQGLITLEILPAIFYGKNKYFANMAKSIELIKEIWFSLS